MSTRHLRAPFGALLLAATLAACGGDRVLSPAAHTPSPSLQLYGQGSRAGLVTACQADGYRQFDFWVGKWSVGAIRPNGTIGSAP